MNIKDFRIGNQTAFMALSPFDPFNFALENQFKAFEWFPDKKESGAGWEIADISKKERRLIKDSAYRHDISLSVHAPWWATPLNPESELIIEEQIPFAVDIGAKLLNIHLHNEAGIEPYLRAISPVIKQCMKVNIQLAIENTPITHPEEFNELFRLLQQHDPEALAHVGMCFDLGHANLCSSTQNDYISFLDRLAPEVPIIHSHLHENYGDNDAHLVIFSGPSKENDLGIRLFIERLAARNFKGSIILEQWPTPAETLTEARNKLINIIDPTAALQKAPLKRHKVTKKVVPKAQKKQAPKAKKQLLLTDALPELDKKNRSWREKLLALHQQLERQQHISKEDLTALAVYLRFLGTGELACTEDGRHFRPSHHAKLSQQIMDLLLQHDSPENTFILRKIYPWLPSYDSAFTRKEPLTRIRDIAHRNDIPKELKKEIKHTLQNKLHRCAGPEDLKTSKNILNRITAPGSNFSASFVEQFKIFHAELKDFFNATPLEKGLKNILAEEKKSLRKAVERFLEIKQNATDPGRKYNLLQELTKLRSILAETEQLDSSSRSQQIQSVDIALENYAFVLLSELITENTFQNKDQWQKALDLTSVTVTNILLNAQEGEEWTAIKEELKAWKRQLDLKNKLHLLRLKATMERCQRMADTYSAIELQLFNTKAYKIGQDLKVSPHAMELYCEGEIRGSLIFQLSKISDILLQNIRLSAELSPWDIIVPGSASGALLQVENLANIPEKAKQTETILLVHQAEGDESVPEQIQGIILAHHVPHLSHLAIRTRQQGVPFVVAEDAEEFDRLIRKSGNTMSFKTQDDSVVFTTPAKKTKAKTTIDQTSIIKKRISIPARSTHVLDSEQITLNNGGAKADGLRQLQQISLRQKANFITPQSVLLPFGVMEATLKSNKLLAPYNSTLKKIEQETDENTLLTLAKELAEIIQRTTIPSTISTRIKQTFPAKSRLMVRSSSNCEDLATLSGAGLYDSVANVTTAGLNKAIKKVWASLWKKQAVLSRLQNGIANNQAAMAVLIQEMFFPDYSFVMHTVNPMNNNSKQIYTELAVGQGETLAAANVAGTPYRMICTKDGKTYEMLAFANFSKALHLDKATKSKDITINYSKVALSTNERFRKKISRQLHLIATLVENEFGEPQDIEGALKGDDVILFQSRPQIT